MDILAHTLWTNAAARGANKKLEDNKKKLRIHVGWAAFWGIFPDLFAFTIPFIILMWTVLFYGAQVPDFANHHQLSSQAFSIAPTLYNYSHSLIIWALIFVITGILSKRPRYELLGWALHILIDIPSHAGGFYLTPFLFPISDYRFTHGVSWANRWYMLINYSTLITVWGYILAKKYLRKRSTSKQ